MRRKKILFAVVALLLLIPALLFLREYLLLRRLHSAWQNTPKASSDSTKIEPLQNEKKQRPPAKAKALVSQVVRSGDGSYVTAKADLAGFKTAIEENPELLSRWGSAHWKILGDIPALCLRQLAADAPARLLGVEPGDCITHIDGETVNQPQRNMLIWMGLPLRRRIVIETLRHGKKITYDLRQ
ncbi:MAG: hypothetical protein N2Z22_11925 [Turneriella sp.]|nr:hypothetical protein [Turneriella sp.]